MLELESRVLDLRFERESLQLKVERLQRHVAELLAVIVAGDPNSGHGRSPLTAKSSGNFGAEKQHHLPLSARSEGSPAVSFGLAASGGAPVMIGSSASKAAQLEAVVDSLKLVVDKLHHENVQLKQSGVSSAKFVEASRELKRSREKEREYVEMISQLTAKLTAVEMKAAGRRGGASGSGFSSTSDGAAMGSDLALVQRWKSAQAHAIRLEDELKQVKQQLDTARNVQGTMALISATPLSELGRLTGHAATAAALSSATPPAQETVASFAVAPAPRHEVPASLQPMGAGFVHAATPISGGPPPPTTTTSSMQTTPPREA